MASNHKLTEVIGGRAIKAVQHQGALLQVAFDDGSTMTVKTAPGASADPPQKRVQKVRQQDTTLNLDYEDGTTAAIQTAEPTSSVMVRDKNGELEYAD